MNLKKVRPHLLIRLCISNDDNKADDDDDDDDDGGSGVD